MQKDSGSSNTITSTERRKNGSPSLTSHALFIEAYDSHLMRHEGSLDSEKTWKGRTYTQHVAVIYSNLPAEMTTLFQ